MVASHMTPTWDLACNPGMCPRLGIKPAISRLALNPLSHISRAELFFHLGHISLSWRTCYIVRGRALGIHQGEATHMAALWCCMWGKGLRGNSAAFSPLHWLSVTSPTSHKQLGPSGADTQVVGFVYILVLCGSPQ